MGGYALAFIAHEFDDAVAFMDRGLAVNPNSAQAWMLSAWLRVWRGEPDLALDHVARALRLSPLDPTQPQFMASISFGHFCLRRFEEASLWAGNAVREQPNLLSPLLILAASAAHMERLDEARRLVPQILHLSPSYRLSRIKERVPFRRPQDIALFSEGLRLAGTDANPKPIEWDRQNLPCIEFNHNELQPPLSYKNQSFDLIYALSVFTHIPLAWQGAWLDELHRVLRPGGYLLCTFHGENFVNSMLNSGDRLRLQRKGNLTLDAKSAQATYSTQVLGSWDVYQSRDEIRKAVGKNFEFLCYEPEATCHQDTVVLRKSASPV